MAKNSTIIEKLRLAKSQTKFQSKLAKMYYCGTEEDAKVFVERLEECCRENDGKK